MADNKTIEYRQTGKIADSRSALVLLLKIVFIQLPAFVFMLPCFSQEFTYKEKKELANFPEYTMQAGYSPYRNYFVVCIGNNTVEIYDKNWKKVYTHQGNPKAVGGHYAFSPDEKYLACAKYKSNSDIAIIRLADMKVTQVLLGHNDHISKLTFSNNGKYLASCSSDNTVRTWQWEGDELVPMQVFTEHNESVEGVSFSYDDRFLASARYRELGTELESAQIADVMRKQEYGQDKRKHRGQAQTEKPAEQEIHAGMLINVFYEHVL